VHSSVPDSPQTLQLPHYAVPNDDEHWSAGSLVSPGRGIPAEDPGAEPVGRGGCGVLQGKVPGGTSLRLESLC